MERDLDLIFLEWDLNPAYKEERSKSIEYYSGGNFLDIGAFLGAYSYFLSHKAFDGSFFISCEPDKRFIKDLDLNLVKLKEKFPRINYSSLNDPFGDGGKIKINTPNIGPNGEIGHPQFMSVFGEDEAEKEILKSITVDDLISFSGIEMDELSFIKIDVEGAEFAVLKGMKNVLEKNLTICLEIHKTFLPVGQSEKLIRQTIEEKDFNCLYEIDRGDQVICYYRK